MSTKPNPTALCTSNLNTPVTDGMLEAVVAEADKHNISRAEFVRQAITLHLARYTVMGPFNATTIYNHPVLSELTIADNGYLPVGNLSHLPRREEPCGCDSGGNLRHVKYELTEGGFAFGEGKTLYVNKDPMENVVLTSICCGPKMTPYYFYVCERCHILTQDRCGNLIDQDVDALLSNITEVK